jgi:hypothetical protein
MSTLEAGESAAIHVAKIAMMGGICSGLGAIAYAEVPVVKKSVDALHNQLHKSTALCSETPYLRHLFKDNSLLHNKLVTEFFCINAVETVLIGGGIVTLGAIMKMSGIKPNSILQKQGIDAITGLHP